MDDKKFKDMDQSMMKKMEPLREQKISEGMLKGFSASVERRISANVPKHHRAFQLAWAPAMAVMVLASVAVLRSPIAPSFLASDKSEVQLAEAVITSEGNQDDMAALSELGVLDEYEDIESLAEEEALLEEGVEISKNLWSTAAIG